METDLHMYEASLLPGGANNAHTIARAQAGETGDEEPGFFDTVLDIVNPLQHLPIISDIYRELTGDTLAPAARLVGGALFGGPIGFASSLVNAVIEQDSGRDIGGHAMAALGLGGDDPTPYMAQAPGEGTRELAAAEAVTSTPRAQAEQAAPARPPAPAAGDRALPLSKTDRQTQAMRLARAERDAAEAAVREPAANGAESASTTLDAVSRPPAADIFWTGERVDPRPGAASIELPAAPNDIDGDQAAAATPATAPVPTPQAAAAAPAEAPQDQQAANAAWLAAAFEDARSQRTAQETGAPAERPEAQPWMASAMSAALDKYEAMARQRAAQPTTAVSR